MCRSPKADKWRSTKWLTGNLLVCNVIFSCSRLLLLLSKWGVEIWQSILTTRGNSGSTLRSKRHQCEFHVSFGFCMSKQTNSRLQCKLWLRWLSNSFLSYWLQLQPMDIASCSTGQIGDAGKITQMWSLIHKFRVIDKMLRVRWEPGGAKCSVCSASCHNAVQ